MNLIPKHPLHSLDSFFDDAFPSFRLMPQSRFESSRLAVDIKKNNEWKSPVFYW